ncbi:MAG: GYF domain-containing protein [Myxococcales bacterium]
MQFSCDSCHALLQISDEKLRGKRLVVKCKRCGARIQIADPGLRTPARVEPVLATPRSVATVSGVPTAPDSDTESTRAIDSGLLARAIRASKGEAVAAEQQGEGWFALIANKQEGPFSRAELALKTAQGIVGPRTYLWREGMTDWIRAKDVPEAAPFFAEPPLPRGTPVSSPRIDAAAQGRETPFANPAAPATATPLHSRPVEERGPVQDFAAPRRTPPRGNQPAAHGRAETSPEDGPAEAEEANSARDLAQWASSELEHESAPNEPLVSGAAEQQRADSRPRGQGSASERRKKPLPWVIVGIAVVVIAGVAAAAILLTGREAPRPSPGPLAPVAPRPSPPPEPVKPPPEEPPSAAPGLNAIEVKRKLDEAKPQLQACIDEALKRDPKLKVAGRIRISTTIAPSGAVTSATIDNKTVDASPLGACLKRTTQHIVFPAFSGDPFEVDIPISVSAG